MGNLFGLYQILVGVNPVD